MKKLDEYVGNYYQHPKYRLIKVIGVVENSRTKLEAVIKERGPGYDSKLKKHTGVKRKHGWFLGKNRAYGDTVTVDHRYLKEDLTHDFLLDD
jgi:hypothetical protein